MPLLFRDASRLLNPQRISVLDTGPQTNTDNSISGGYIHCDAALVLSDISELCQGHPNDGMKKSKTLATHKLRFYAAQIITLPSSLLISFASEVAAHAQQLEKDTLETENLADGRKRESLEPNPGRLTSTQARKPVIEEL